MKPHPWADLPNFGIKPTSLHQRMVLFWARSNAMRVGQEASKCMHCIRREKKERLHKSRRWAVTFESWPPAAGVFRCFVTSSTQYFSPSKWRPQHHISQTKRPARFGIFKVGSPTFSLWNISLPLLSLCWGQTMFSQTRPDITLQYKILLRKSMLGYPGKAMLSGPLIIRQLLYHFRPVKILLKTKTIMLRKRHQPTKPIYQHSCLDIALAFHVIIFRPCLELLNSRIFCPLGIF